MRLKCRSPVVIWRCYLPYWVRIVYNVITHCSNTGGTGVLKGLWVLDWPSVYIYMVCYIDGNTLKHPKSWKSRHCLHRYGLTPFSLEYRAKTKEHVQIDCTIFIDFTLNFWLYTLLHSRFSQLIIFWGPLGAEELHNNLKKTHTHTISVPLAATCSTFFTS